MVYVKSQHWSKYAKDLNLTPSPQTQSSNGSLSRFLLPQKTQASDNCYAVTAVSAVSAVLQTTQASNSSSSPLSSEEDRSEVKLMR